MLELEIVPERSIGCEQWEFILGMHFSQAVSIIQSQVGIIKGVQVIYSDSNPLNADLVLNLPQDGIRLVFDSVVQRLKIIEIYNMKLVKLKYWKKTNKQSVTGFLRTESDLDSQITLKLAEFDVARWFLPSVLPEKEETISQRHILGLVFNSPEVCPSIEQIEHSFGATHPGVYDAEKHLFVLNFRGLSFSFYIETTFQPSLTHGLGSLQFASGSSPCVTCTSVYSGHSLAGCAAPPLPLSCYCAQLYLHYVDVLRDNERTKGVRLHLYTDGGVGRSRKQSLVREVHFADTCQDVATLLGTPQRVFFKAEDKMKIHSPNAHRRVTARRSDFFFNYFSLGMDILFDARTQKVKKFVLHTNYPGHYNFNTYQRCEFHLGVPSNAGDKKPVQISAYTKWDTVCEKVKPSERPVVLNRASSTNTTNPFGSTFCYGFQDIIFEVMSNQHIASVTLYLTKEGCHV